MARVKFDGLELVSLWSDSEETRLLDVALRFNDGGGYAAATHKDVEVLYLLKIVLPENN